MLVMSAKEVRGWSTTAKFVKLETGGGQRTPTKDQASPIPVHIIFWFHCIALLFC